MMMKKTSSIRASSNDDHFMSLKASQEKKCNVYVHHYNKDPKISHKLSDCSEIHRNTYKHEYSDFYNQKFKTLKDQFDNLSLRSIKAAKPKIIPDVVASPISKFNKLLFHPGHKAAVDKLEETYWSKWKPKAHYETKKLPCSKKESSNAKLKYADKQIESNFETKEDEFEADCIYKEPLIENVSHEVQVPDPEVSEIGVETEADEVNIYKTPKPSNMQIAIIEEQSLETITPVIYLPLKKSDVTLKHTDSFILTSKKQSEEKQHFQQPRCIKLFKNAGYVSSTSTHFVKGGSYPLKSCLKKDNNKNNCLGRPGSPIKISLSNKGAKK